MHFLWNGRKRALKQTVVYAMLMSLLFSLLPPAAYANDPQTAQPSGSPVYLVNDTFEDGTLPSEYKVTLPAAVVAGQEVAVTDVTGTGNSSGKALQVNDTGAGNVQFVRSFDPQTGDVVIESDFMFPQESGTSSLFEVKNAEGNKTAFIIGVRVPTQPAEKTSGNTLIYDLKSSQYYGLMNPFLPMNQWHNIRMEIKTAQSKVSIYIDNQPVKEFDFTTPDVGNIGQVLSKTPGGGRGQFLIDNFKVYTPSTGGDGGDGGPENPALDAPAALNGYVNAVNGAPAVWLGWESVTGAVYYNIKRSDTREGTYNTLQSVSQSVYSVMDSSVTAGKTYFYTVTASTHNVAAGAAGGVESAPSSVFEITAALPDTGIAVNIPAFPGAEGGGKYVTGGRGGEVYIVDTLADYSKSETAIPGSLRDAVSKDNRTIIFRVGGTIHLKESLSITGSNLTIAGQTAPGDGITVSDYTTNINANNLTIRYVHFRLTDRYPSEDDSLGSRYYKDIIIDHCSFSWAVDEVVSLYENSII